MREDIRGTDGLTRRALLGATCVIATGSVLSACTKSVPVPSKTPRDGEIVGDGNVDDAPALQALLERSARLNAQVTLPAGLVLRLGSGIRVPSGTNLDGNGCTFLNSSQSSTGRLLTITQSSNVVIKNLVLDGNRDQFQGTTEQRHNLLISGAENVFLSRIVSRNAKGDGLYIGDQLNGPSTSIRVLDSTFEHNFRQGMSVTAASGLILIRCHFIYTQGTMPSAGVDIEPNTDDSLIEDVSFIECLFARNAGGGLLISLRNEPMATQTGGHYERCVFEDNVANGVLMQNSENASFSGGHIRGNGRNGVFVTARGDHGDGTTSNTVFAGVSIEDNREAGALIVASFDRMLFDECTLAGNGHEPFAANFGVEAVPTASQAGVGLRISRTKFRQMAGGIKTSASCTGVELAGNSFDAVTTKLALATHGVSDGESK